MAGCADSHRRCRRNNGQSATRRTSGADFDPETDDRPRGDGGYGLGEMRKQEKSQFIRELGGIIRDTVILSLCIGTMLILIYSAYTNTIPTAAELFF